MYIRRVTTRRTASGEAYHNWRLVESRREGGRGQAALLNLGRHFDLPEALWPALCARLGQLLGNQGDWLPVDLPETVETHAQALASEFVEVDVASLERVQPRSVGVEQVGLHALAQLELDPLLASLGVNALPRARILAQVVGRMAAPGSELSTWGWLTDSSALPEWLDLSLPDLSIMRLYRAADVLMKHQAAIETHLFGRVRDLFALEATVTL